MAINQKNDENVPNYVATHDQRAVDIDKEMPNSPLGRYGNNSGGFAGPRIGGGVFQFGGRAIRVNPAEFDCMTLDTEVYFSEYMTMFSKVFQGSEEILNEEAKTDIRLGIIFIRQVREFVLAQNYHHLETHTHALDPFFNNPQVPHLIPVPKDQFKAAHTIALPQYFQRLTQVFPGFSAPIHLQYIANGPMADAVSVGINAVSAGPMEHFLIMPDPVDILNAAKKVQEFKRRQQQF